MIPLSVPLGPLRDSTASNRRRGRKVRRQQHPDRRREFDLIAYNADTLFLNETKSDPSAGAFRRFVRDESVFEYFPELAGRKLVGIAAAGGCFQSPRGRHVRHPVPWQFRTVFARQK